MQKLFLVHLGYYSDLGDGVYESHTNIFVVASDFEEARSKAKLLDIVRENRMHIDGMQLIEAVKGFSIVLQPDDQLRGQDRITPDKFRELAPKPTKNDN